MSDNSLTTGRVEKEQKNYSRDREK